MKTTDFKYNLPKNLIAKYPIMDRSRCRLLLLDIKTGAIEHVLFLDIVEKLVSGDLVIFNDTRVIPARLYGRTSQGESIEILIERVLNDFQALAYIHASKLIKLGTNLFFGKNLEISGYITNVYCENYSRLFKICFNSNIYRDVLSILNHIGHIPIPPYLKRIDEPVDYELYQTIYSVNPGSVASPTAGLHFDSVLIKILLKMGIEIAFITLHIGSATFKPVRSNMIKNHIMHSEYIEVPKKTVEAILRCKNRGNRVIAVGTTVVKSLETASIYAKDDLLIEPFSGYAKTFIYPGFKFHVVDALITNFHLPESTLIMLVTAFAGYKNTLRAYHEAIFLQYRFLSYGDAMFIMYKV